MAVVKMSLKSLLIRMPRKGSPSERLMLLSRMRTLLQRAAPHRVALAATTPDPSEANPRTIFQLLALVAAFDALKPSFTC